MKTTSVLIQSLCVPCSDRCRYCLLSWDGKTVGAGWERSVSLAERYIKELKEQAPDIKTSFSFGYSMEHPDLRQALRTLRRLGSPAADFLQCDGMKMRDEKECASLTDMLVSEGVKELNFTVYGPAEYHDRFAGRKGDFELILRMMAATKNAGLYFTAGVPLTGGNIDQTDGVVNVLKSAGCGKIRLFIPHEEGRGRSLSKIRLRQSELRRISPENRGLLNGNIYRSEGEWLKEPEPVREDERMILVSLRADNIDGYEKRGALSVVREIEQLDEAYYASFPGFKELADMYGDKSGDKMYRYRDLYHHYRTLYAEEHGVSVYDVTDERQSGSRRF